MRLRLWLLCFPLVLAGSEVAHTLLGAVAPPGYLGAELFEARSATADLLAPLAGLGAGLVVAGLALAVLRGGSRTSPPAWLFGCLPPLLFTVQEEVEHALGHHHIAILVLSPTFLVGLGLQLPFALLAWVVAALLLRLTAVVASRLRPVAWPVRAAGLLPGRPAEADPAPDAWLLAGPRLSRGPPSSLVA